ncbi:helix-turn-helix domain-containing protein [Alicyclobacillus cycloheptanicus]|uniref:XRE family transcriptional regulator of biofilm formation n=1 Tax=Alicyclobacillus cycloheptanicus TaxID=1457 RepID=A0ABT9XM41_9BACL|nr:helix-turn-helix domain-containing protein [Alicyclobacillus cycloheptanicus]MDQ0191195.1 XRE family transcriptional regulator of biofilm formation [Alicyclobacillus cycloheptanicus]WDM02110.1 helix-turn-helix domain-containing protein [Alicyclobacillus cycloheptanicus]
MLGERIHRLRLEKNLSLSELADRAGIAKSYLSAIERFIQVNPSIHVIEKLASVLGVPVQYLIQSEDEALPADSVDPEWIDIVKEAMASGVSKDEFREFLEFQKWRRQAQPTEEPSEK